MSTFKIKHDRNKTRVHIQTLDETHKKIMSDFEKKRATLPNKKRKLEILQKQLAKLDLIKPNLYTTEDIKRKADLKTEIVALTDQIYDIDNDISELEYYSKTEDIIMDYYNIIEMNDNDLYEQFPELKQKQVEGGGGEEGEGGGEGEGEGEGGEGEKENSVSNTIKRMEPDESHLDKLNMINKQNQKKKRKVTKKRKRGVNQNPSVNIIDLMFNAAQPQETDKEETETEVETETETETEVEGEKKSVEPIVDIDDTSKNKAKLFDQYMMLIDSDYLSTKVLEALIKRCGNCNIEKTLIHAEGIYVCQKCGEAEAVIIDSEKPNYKESVPDNKPSVPYRKSNHLNELCFWSYLSDVLCVLRGLKYHNKCIL
jgi:hypothetical protein